MKKFPASTVYDKQIEILKRRLRVVKILEETQGIFSTATFVICTANFTSCLTDLSQIILYASQNIGVTIISVLFGSTSAVASLACIFLCAGQVPIEMKRISTITRRLFEQKAIWGIAEENAVVERLMLNEEECTLSGCELIFFKKSTVLTLIGTILTYGLLIFSMDLKVD
ncbi:hypothetical protein AVEN_178733-1 [Araneus ventricosus]|uniref:Uncharacterized protein n=1 Tax=Araneus ventricosus TaxID=182803 RepID=A0A4Y2L711_ARAVE|nr:hypothetical protein AVEN_178733-1 [Araneus ventricosus]